MSDTGQGAAMPPTNPAIGSDPLVDPTYPMSTTDIGSATGTTGGSSGTTTDTARQQAGQVAQDAKESGKQVVGTAKEQGRDVLNESRRQVRDLTSQAQRQVQDQSRVQKDRAATNLRSLADELGAIGSGTGGQSGIATDLARQAAGSVQDLAGWLESREPGQLVEELRGFARRKPGTFLLGALAAGVAAGRLTRGVVDEARSDGGPDKSGDASAPSSSAWADEVDLTAGPASGADPLSSGSTGTTGAFR